MLRQAWFGVACLGAVGGSARADVLQATLEQPLFEVSHTVDVRIEDGVATYRVKRQFANPGKIADEAGLEIALPTGGVATGLRIRAKDRWYDGELMERDTAAALYHELTGHGAHVPKDPALLQWMWADTLYLQIFPVMPGGVSTVEYTITVPTRYTGGRYWISYPRVAPAAPGQDDSSRGLALATPILTVHPDWGDALTPILVDGKRVAPDTAVVLNPPVKQPWEDAVGADPGASYVASTIEIAASSRTEKTFSTAKVTFAIQHTYKSDVKVELLAPDGEVYPLFDRKGGGDNNISGTFDVKLKKPIKATGTWRLVASDHVGLDNGSVDKWSIVLGENKAEATDTPIFIPDAPQSANDAGLASIAVSAPSSTTMWQGRYGKVVASKEHSFGRLEVDTSPQLVPLPKKAQVVFAIDSSFSTTPEMIDAHLAIIKTYVAHVPDAEVEILAYRRYAKRVFNKFVAVKDLPAAIEAAKKAGAFALGNGSAIDDAIKVAQAVLADRKGPRRVIFTTDRLLRSTLKPEQAIAAMAKLPKDIVVHTIAPHLDNDDQVTLERNDADPLAPLATKHHGIFVELRGLPTAAEKIPATEKLLLPVVLELVRPTRVEKLKASGFSLDSDVLREGEGIRLFTKGKTVPANVTLTGMLWSDPVKKVVNVGNAFSRSTAAFIFGEDEYHDLSEAEQLKVAFMGRAVSPVTSYVAYEPGTRPSTIGLNRIGHGSGSGSGYGSGGGRGGMRAREKIDFAKLIDTKACVAQHKPAAGWKVQLTVETTNDEIVDVQITGGAGALASCLAETTWTIRLDNRFYHERETFIANLGG